MRSIIRYLRQRKFSYNPLIEVFISRENLLHNIRVYEKILGDVKIAPVLKSNAYGHGLIQIAQILDEENHGNFPFFMVDSYHEALILRNEKIKTPFVVLGFTRTLTIEKSRLKNVAFTITGFEQLKTLSENLTSKTVFHLKVDTGMGRQGVSLAELDSSLDMISANSNIVLEGVVSHFADADNSNEVYTRDQIEKWNSVVEKVEARFPKLSFYHISNSAGAYYVKDIKANVARVGIGLYGIRLNPKRDIGLDLKPVLEMKSIISGIRSYERGDRVGYSMTYKAKDKIKAATLPLGYYEGIDRRLSNEGFVKIKNIFCLIIGRVSLNITSVDITKVKECNVEDEVIVISRETSDKNSVEAIAKTCNTTPYDILVHIPGQIRRTVV